jgi:hypothetical protein
MSKIKKKATDKKSEKKTEAAPAKAELKSLPVGTKVQLTEEQKNRVLNLDNMTRQAKLVVADASLRAADEGKKRDAAIDNFNKLAKDQVKALTDIALELGVDLAQQGARWSFSRTENVFVRQA